MAPDAGVVTLAARCTNRAGQDGRSQVSDKAKPAVLLMRSPRGSGKGRPIAARPFSVSCTRRAGTKTLVHPSARSGTLPTGTLITKASPKSYQVSAISSSGVSTISVQKARVSPDLEKTASMTGSV